MRAAELTSAPMFRRVGRSYVGGATRWTSQQQQHHQHHHLMSRRWCAHGLQPPPPPPPPSVEDDDWGSIFFDAHTSATQQLTRVVPTTVMAEEAAEVALELNDVVAQEEYEAAEEIMDEVVVGGSVVAPSQTPEDVVVATACASTDLQAQQQQQQHGPIITGRMCRRGAYLHQQDAQYLAYPTPLEARVGRGAAAHKQGGCVLVGFATNDLRIHDNYALALASTRAHAAGGLPVVAVCVLDYRSFAQPTPVAGFFSTGPLRARFLLANVAALRASLEERLGVPLLIRVGRPEEHLPRLAVELNAVDVFITTQIAPHERRIHKAILERVKHGRWISRRMADDNEDEDDDVVSEVHEHHVKELHPYGAPPTAHAGTTVAVPHSVWQHTLVHVDDLQTPLTSMKEGERWFHDDVTTSSIRPTKAYDASIERLSELPRLPHLLPTREELAQREPPPIVRGRLPTLHDLGYSAGAEKLLLFEDGVIATQSSHPTAGEDAAMEHVRQWLNDGGFTSLLRVGRERRTNTKMYSHRLARASPYLSMGVLSPRRFYEMMRQHALEHQRDGFAQQQFREGVLRLSRRDYWQWMGMRFGDGLLADYGPRPENTDDVADWRHDPKIIQRWCNALTGIPFADAAMRELISTGMVASEGRQGLVWLLSRGYGQDWRIAAEWLARCSIDYDPLVCFGNAAYVSELLRDDFGEPVRNIHFLAHHHDQTGIYIKKWLPQLSKIPPVYIHRPHILTPRMMAMHQVVLGRNYPYPIKLWEGAERELGANALTAYFAKDDAGRAGYGEAARLGCGLLAHEEWPTHAAQGPTASAELVERPWCRHYLPSSAFDGWEEEKEEVMQHVLASSSNTTPRPTLLARTTS